MAVREASVQPPEPAEPEMPAPRAGRPRRLVNSIALLGAVGVLAGLAFFFYDRMNHIYVQDSRIGAEVVSLASRVPGWVTKFHVETTDMVKKGDLLVSVDSREADTELAELEARLRALSAQREVALAEIETLDKRTSSNVTSYEYMLEAARAQLAAVKTDLDMARSDFDRAESLMAKNVISRQRWEEDRSALRRAEQAHQRAEAEVATAQAALLEAEAERGELEVARRRLEALEFEAEQVRAQRDRQRLNIADREIRSPIDGVIDTTFVNEGEYVMPGQRLLMLHDPSKVWVDANVMETDIRYLRPGMPATVTVDAYPGEVFEGEIVRVGDAATNQFSLLPSPNPSGNFTKITQRLAVRIALEQRGNRLRPGMMVEVAFDVSDR